MQDLTENELFRDAKDRIIMVVEQIRSAGSIAIFATADLDSIVSLAFLESAMMDAKIPYSRKVLNSTQDQPKGQDYSFNSTAQLVISIEQYEDTWSHSEVDDQGRLRIVPLSISVTHPNSDKQHNGALDVVIQSAAIAALIAPNGTRVRRLRSISGSGQWLRTSLDHSDDPVYTKLRDLLQDEGSIRLVPLPEVESPITSMIQDFPESILKRLTKRWGKMDFEQRKQAMSELSLPTLSAKNLSTPRLEELLWFRILIGDEPLDLHSQIHIAKSEWPSEEMARKDHAREVLNSLISTGKFC